jgi:predicted dinucleotide-binding enzyme
MEPVTKPNKTLAIAGAGKLGIVLAQLALKAGYTVYITGSESPEKIRLSVQVLAPGAVATTLADATEHSNVIILALPLGKYQSIPKDLLAGK